MRLQRLDRLRRHDLLDVPTDHVRRRTLRQLLPVAVDQDVPTVGVAQVDGRHGVIQHVLQATLALAHVLDRPLVLLDLALEPLGGALELLGALVHPVLELRVELRQMRPRPVAAGVISSEHPHAVALQLDRQPDRHHQGERHRGRGLAGRAGRIVPMTR